MGRLNAEDMSTLTYHDLKASAGSLVSSASIIPVIPALPSDPPAPEAAQTVICGDALTVMAAMPSGSIDVIATSPPYNISLPYRSYDDDREPGNYLDWMGAFAAEFARLLTEDGSVFLNIGAGSNPWQAMDVAHRFREHLVLQNGIIWVKSIAVDGVTRGHVRPINSGRYLNRAHEQILHFTKRGDIAIDRLAIGVPYTDKSNLKRWRTAAQDLRCAGNVWLIPYETSSRDKGMRHPAPFPLELPRRCLKLHGAPGTVLDPFLGSGTTLVAAKELGWRGIGVELDPEYAALARQRIAAVEVPGGR